MTIPEFEHEQCINKKDHEPHLRNVIEAEYDCNGVTECGEQAHPAHTVTVGKTVECLGVCNCKLLNYKHGPRDHRR